MRTGIEIIEDVPGCGAPVARHNWYKIRLKIWLHRGESVRWERVWGTSPAELNDNGETLVTHVRIDREQLIAGLFYGCEGMHVGGRRILRIAPHLAYREQGVPGIIPANALLTAELEFINEGLPA
ncbi:FKBP-type peptidyl-prolyl cis-trans isomerase [uncultured Alcanivorax sp.]|uniref:FKBP-type peptidyl-prolyl cis-trans isomerase n=1 Tax=uncultured Alcanivorax sp. TaxID=191215 RepID=UPI0026365704|nr:FKBP-type peptidyl-prolyl cis-trans isomerase [uncultured Alcanivorax sp.]